MSSGSLRIQEVGSFVVRPLIAGNWKMNGLQDALTNIKKIAETTLAIADSVDTVVFPPATLLERAAFIARASHLKIGGQDCSSEIHGAFTGELSAEMLSDAGATFALVGHSERRQRHSETDDTVRQKAIRALTAGLRPVICIGESADQKNAGQTLEVLSHQIMQVVPRTADFGVMVIAYEPLWAIGTGLRPEDVEIAKAHTHIRQELASQWGEKGQQIPILYGGSVNLENAQAILRLPNVNGLLIGGASLDAAQFSAICVGASANLAAGKL